MSKVYYSLDRIHKQNANYHVVFGGRSDGKTYEGGVRMLQQWQDDGTPGAYIRRLGVEVTKRNMDQLFAAIVANNEITRITNGEWDRVEYKSQRFYLARYDEALDKVITQSKPFCFIFVLSTWMSTKGPSYPDIKFVMFDEFISSDGYLFNEFKIFKNILSTIIRDRGKMKVYLFGNTISKNCPYFEGFKITKLIHTMTKGEIKLIVTERLKNRIALEYSAGVYDSESGDYSKDSDVFFDFGEEQDMITDGSWDIEMYDHAPFPIENEMVVEKFYIKTKEYSDDGELLILQGNVVHHDDNLFIYIHTKHGKLYDEDNRMIYSLEISPKMNHEVSIMKGGRNKIAKRIAQLFKVNQVYVQHNEVGEAVRNYLRDSERFSNFDI